MNPLEIRRRKLWRAHFFLLGLCLALAVPAHAGSARRLLIDHDGHNLFSTLSPDFKRDIDEAVAACPGNVTTYLLCAGAGRYYYPTRVGEVDPRCVQLGLELAQGRDPFGYFLERLRRSGKETFVTMRMNDVHEPAATDEWNLPRVRREHPDCIVDAAAVARGDTEWMNWCLDYSRPEVRSFMLAIAAELLERYPFDGLQLDWMRFPRHLSGTPAEVWAKRGYLTDFVVEVSTRCRARGRQLIVRVPTSIAGCTLLGIDLPEWTRRKLVDAITTAPFLNTDFFQPIAETRAALGANPVPIYAGFDADHGAQRHSRESLRAACTGLYASGAEGISIFNFPCWSETLGSVPFDWLEGLESAATAARKPLLFSVPTTRFRRDYEQPGLLPATIAAGGTLTIPLPLPPAAMPADRARIVINSSSLPTRVMLNGSPVELLAKQRSPELFVEMIDLRDPTTRRPTREESHTYRLDAAQLRAGNNTLELRNDAATPLEVRRINLGLW